MIWNFFKKKTAEVKQESAEIEPDSFLNLKTEKQKLNYDTIVSQSIAKDVSQVGTMDSINTTIQKPFGGLSIVNNKQLDYFAKQSFIGFQTCSIIAQHWLVNKGVTIPAKDAIRKGYELTFNSGVEVSPEDKKKIRDLDKKYKIKKNLVEFVKMGRVFGIRVAIIKVKSTDPTYYENPFNIDAVSKGSYEGISQVDPYWVTPFLTSENVTDPSAINFYEPTYWIINGVKYHHTHLVIMRTDEVSDILKPSYFYAGISYPQKVMTRVYSAEQTANEAPLLAQTKRTNIFKTNLNAFATNLSGLSEKINNQTLMQDNYGKMLIGKDDEVTSLDTSLADLDTVIMTQYQIVAAELNIPITKLMGTTLKGFSSGESEQDSYIEELENIQDYDMTPLLERHYECVIKSELQKEYTFEIVWNGLKVLSDLDKATIRQNNSNTDMNYINSGVLSPDSVRQKLIEDKDSGYNGLDLEDDFIQEEDDEENQIN